MVRFIGSNNVEYVFYYQTPVEKTGISILSYNIFMRSPRIIFPNVHFTSLIKRDKLKEQKYYHILSKTLIS
jgi:hypothetical protein